MADRTYLGGFTNTVLHEESDGTLIVEERQDCQSILDANQRKRDQRFDSWSPGGNFQEAFDVPMVEVLRWQRECGAAMFSEEHMAYMDAKLREPAYAKLATAPRVRDPHIIMRGTR
jgi:hypothetical protein